MTLEDKRLLLIDLSARLPYGVLVHYCNKSHIFYTNDFVLNERFLVEYRTPDCHVELRPYLRPMSSMTQEEYKELKSISPYYGFAPYEYIGDWCPNYEMVDWCNKNHFDYRGLLPMGLALEASKEMYKFNK